MKKIYPFSFYLTFYGANACLFPYWVLYYQSLGFTGTQIGLLSALSPLIFLAGAPFWTGIADTTRRHKLVMGATLLVSIGLAIIFPFARSIVPVLVMSMLISFIVSPANSFADSATLTMLGDQKAMYGRVRLGGTIGYGIAASIAGIVIEKYGLNWAFWLYAALMLVAFLVSRKFTFNQVRQKVSIKHGVHELFSNRRLVLFLAIAFVCGMALTSINMYFSAYMVELGIGESIIGVAFTIGTIAELPFLFFADRLLAKLKPHGMLILSMIATIVRLFLYATVTTKTGILVFQLINGITYASLWVAGVSYVNEIAPPGLSATAQGIFGATVFGFGSAAAGFLGAILLESIGGARMYAVFGGLMLAALVIYLVLEKKLPKVEYVKV
jgi:MFS transporter, PPP family, 3-phenylpropionic acid transporter